MSTRVNCHCGQAFVAAEHLAGKTVPCPFCGAALTISSAPQKGQPAFSSPLFVWCSVALAAAMLLAAVGWRMIPHGKDVATGAPAGPVISAPNKGAFKQPASQKASQPAKRINRPKLTGPPLRLGEEPDRVALPTEFSPASGSTWRESAPPSGVFVVGPGMYEITAPGGESLKGREELIKLGWMIAGKIRLPETAEQGELLIEWGVTIYPSPRASAENKNRAARSIKTGGLRGTEGVSEKQILRIYNFPDHMLVLGATGKGERMNWGQARRILDSVRRTGSIPPEVAARAAP